MSDEPCLGVQLCKIWSSLYFSLDPRFRTKMPESCLTVREGFGKASLWIFYPSDPYIDLEVSSLHVARVYFVSGRVTAVWSPYCCPPSRALLEPHLSSGSCLLNRSTQTQPSMEHIRLYLVLISKCLELSGLRLYHVLISKCLELSGLRLYHVLISKCLELSGLRLYHVLLSKCLEWSGLKGVLVRTESTC